VKTLFIVNDPPYGTERCYNALRLAHALFKIDPESEVTVFLLADAVLAAKSGQKTPDGDARGLAESDMMQGARRGTMEELAAATLEADKVLVL
jgi:uncharacterized protein involved in oxidation of intracellular sulfur